MKRISESHQERSKYRTSKQSGITCKRFLRWSRSRFERRFKSCVCFSKKSTWTWKLKSIRRSQSIRCNNNLLARHISSLNFFDTFKIFKSIFLVQSLQFIKFSFCQNRFFYTAIFSFSVTSFLFSSKYFWLSNFIRSIISHIHFQKWVTKADLASDIHS